MALWAVTRSLANSAACARRVRSSTAAWQQGHRTGVEILDEREIAERRSSAKEKENGALGG